MSKYLVQHFLDESQNSSRKNNSIICEKSKISYENLYLASNRLANCLISNGLKRQDRVAIYMKRSERAIISIMSTLKADAIYVPIDPKSPSERLLKILEDCTPTVIVCDGELAGSIVDIVPQIAWKIKIVILEYRELLPSFREEDNYIFRDHIDFYSPDCPKYRNIDTDLAYILYTSGSTGDPKGVMISHLNIKSYIEWAVNCFEIEHNDNILNTTPFHFDMSTFDIYCSLKARATLCIATESQLLFPIKLLDFIESENISIWKGVSSLLMYIDRTVSLREKSLPSLKKIIFAGETLPTKYLIEWMRAYPEIYFYNAYGPTEATGISTYYPITRIPNSPKERIPIGKACKNTEAFILKHNNSITEIEEIGELCIRGSGLSPGYWNDKKKTEESFIENPLSIIPGDRIFLTGDIAKQNQDGNLEFLGRIDNQIKSMGYRIDLTEIENAMIATGDVADAAVISAKSKMHNIDELIAFVVIDDKISMKNIVKEIRNKIPSYMLPKQVKMIRKIPRTENGKIDRKKLKEML